MKRICVGISILAFVSSLGAPRAGAGATTNDAVSASIFPERLELPAGVRSHRVLVTGRSGDGFEFDLTSQVRFSSDTPETASVDSSGVVVPHRPGSATIKAMTGMTTVAAEVVVTAAEFEAKLSFINDILPLLSKAGCNAGGCHAKPNGQNGFRLSVFAYDPKSDFKEIVKDARGRRVFPAFPEESLILKKPTLAIEHGGGERFSVGSEPYLRLREWIGQGMPYRPAGDPDLAGIEVFPTERRYRPGSNQSLLVQARYSDGSVRDVTGLAEFDSNQKEIVQVGEEGTLQVGALSGEGVVVVRYMGKVAVSRVTVPSERSLPEAIYGSLPRSNFIDDLAYARFQKLGLFPSERCSDAEFIRRASLDAIGLLPEPDEVREFLADKDPKKRAKLIDRRLEQPEYADHWATKWADLIRPNPARVGVKSVFTLDQWLRASFRQNKPYDQFAREIVTATGSAHQYGPAVVFRDRREPSDTAVLVSQIFLGVRLECARCHHHPNEKWSQDDFYQLAAFFSEVKRKGPGISPPISGGEEFIYHAPGGQVRHPVTDAVMQPKPPDGPSVEPPPDCDPRSLLAAWMIGEDNPFFARAVVNRVWAEFMGRGLVDPVDDFRASNPPTNEGLLDGLAEDFIRHRYDLKHLMRTIMDSHLYQLGSLPNEFNLRDTHNFSRSYRRRLPAEVLMDAVAGVTGTRSSFQGMADGAPAIQAWSYSIDSDFLDAFGRPNSSSDCPCERDPRTSVVQALHLMNSTELQARIAHKQGRAARLAASDLPPEAIITDLYLAAYCRIPTLEELQLAATAFTAPDATRHSATEDVLWALINSAEFVFNH